MKMPKGWKEIRRSFISVANNDVLKIKNYVYSLPKNEQRKYYSLSNSLSNRFYGDTKSLSEYDLKKYNQIIKKV